MDLVPGSFEARLELAITGQNVKTSDRFTCGYGRGFFLTLPGPGPRPGLSAQ